MHHQLVLLSRAMQAWFSWLGMHLASATAKQERLLYLQVSWSAAGPSQMMLNLTSLPWCCPGGAKCSTHCQQKHL